MQNDMHSSAPTDEINKVCDPAKLPVANRYDGRLCPDGIYRNRWGAHFCSVDGCGLVSDWVSGGEELCLFHTAASRCRSEMTQVLHKYRPLVILAKQFERVSDSLDDDGPKPQTELFNAFFELVVESRFFVVKHLAADGSITEEQVPLPIPRYQLEPGQRFVHPLEYVKTVAVGYAEYLAAEKAYAMRNVKTPDRKNSAQLRAAAVLRKIRALGDTWTRTKPAYATAPVPPPAYDDEEVF